MVHPAVVSTAPGNINRAPKEGPTQHESFTDAREIGYAAPTSCKTAAIQGTGLSETAITLISNAWRGGTKRQYDSTLRHWEEFCRPRKVNPITPLINDVVEFLATLDDNGSQYSVLTTARSTLGN